MQRQQARRASSLRFALYDAPVRTKLVLLVSLALTVPMAGTAATSNLQPNGAPSGTIQKRGVLGSTVESLTLRQKIGQLLMSGVSGTSLSAMQRDQIKERHLGGVIMFADNYSSRTQMDAFTAQIQNAARAGNPIKAGGLISVDQEGGVVKRFPDMPPRYSAPKMGRIGKESVAFDEGRDTGRALRSVGVNVNLAPVADIDLSPHVMRDRAFDDNRHDVARLANAFARGLQRPNVAAAAKHFPGLGGATRNSDDGPSYVYRSRRQLRNVDAVPFKGLINNGIRMLMIAHAIYPNDGGSKPASLNPYIMKKRLRSGMDFKGVAISDAIEAIAWRFNGDVAKACKKSIQAGVDVALMTSGPAVAGECADRVYAAVRNRTIPIARIDQAVKRVLRLKRWLGIWSG